MANNAPRTPALWRIFVKLNINMWIIFLTMFLIAGCNYWHAPIREHRTERNLIIETRVPAKVNRGKDYEFVVITNVDSNCFSAIQYFTIQDELEVVYFPQMVTDENGKCLWIWEIPLDAKSGMAEFRAYVEKDKETRYSMPDTFCIDVCR